MPKFKFRIGKFDREFIGSVIDYKQASFTSRTKSNLDFLQDHLAIKWKKVYEYTKTKPQGTFTTRIIVGDDGENTYIYDLRQTGFPNSSWTKVFLNGYEGTDITVLINKLNNGSSAENIWSKNYFK